VILGRVLGLLEPNLHPLVHINRFGVIPKKHQPGRWRLIVDLSQASVNDGIEPELCTLHYTSVDEAVRRVLGWGRGTMLAKFVHTGRLQCTHTTEAARNEVEGQVIH